MQNIMMHTFPSLVYKHTWWICGTGVFIRAITTIIIWVTSPSFKDTLLIVTSKLIWFTAIGIYARNIYISQYNDSNILRVFKNVWPVALWFDVQISTIWLILANPQMTSFLLISFFLLLIVQKFKLTDVYLCKWLQDRISSVVLNLVIYKGVSKCFWTGCLEKELQMVQLSATRCSFIAILWVRLVSFVAITHCVASQWVFIVILLSTQTRNFWIHPHIHKIFHQHTHKCHKKVSYDTPPGCHLYGT
jgi:hypothetical protein